MLTSKTINPLHFEDLEPHRFEDMVRQLIFDLKRWSNLEAPGKSGQDDGFDIRGWEEISNFERDEERSFFDDNVWLIQCKREKSINPQKLEKFLKELLNKHQEKIFGLIFVAACNFSEKTRIKFFELCRSYNLQGWHLYGKSELEDLLYSPKNDHLLYAYFGLSLQMRKRSAKNTIQSKVIMKNNVTNKLDKCDWLLMRDIDGKILGKTRFFENDTTDELESWKIRVVRSEYLAYFKTNERTLEEWDFLESSASLEIKKINHKEELHFTPARKDHNFKKIEKDWSEKIKDTSNRAILREFINIYYKDIIFIDFGTSRHEDHILHEVKAEFYINQNGKREKIRDIRRLEAVEDCLHHPADEDKKTEFFLQK